MKLILNMFLWIAQWLHLRMGGKILYTSNRIIFEAPKGRHAWVPKKYGFNEMGGTWRTDAKE